MPALPYSRHCTLSPDRAVKCVWEVEGQGEKASVVMVVTELQHLQTTEVGCKAQAGFLNSTHLPCLSNAYPQDTKDLKTSVKMYKSVLTPEPTNTLTTQQGLKR